VRTLVTEPAFEFDGAAFDWGDVVVAAIGWGEWQQLERALAEGLACVSDARANGDELDAAELHDATLAFRRSRGLLAGEDYTRWLLERRVSDEDVCEHLARAELRERAGPGAAALRKRHPPDSRQIADAIRGELLLGGQLRRWADHLARCAAAVRGLGGAGGAPPVEPGDATEVLLTAVASAPACGLSREQASERAARVAALAAAEQVFLSRVVTPERIERSLAEHRLDWQRLAWEEVAFASEGAAREAALAVRADGLTLAEVAGVARSPIQRREAYCGDVPELSGMLVGAVAGELLGPFATDQAWRLACVRERVAPASEDPVLHERASEEVAADALARYLAGGVAWHGEY
jgi:hypothetical protein